MQSIFQKRPQHQNIFKNITDSPGVNYRISADNDADDVPNTADDDYGSTYSKILIFI